MIFSTVPVRVTDGFPASALSVGVSLVKGLHSPGRLAAPRYRQLSASRLIFRSSRTSHREWPGPCCNLVPGQNLSGFYNNISRTPAPRPHLYATAHPAVQHRTYRKTKKE